MLHRFDDDPFRRQLQRTELEIVTSSVAAATDLAEHYVGLPFATLADACRDGRPAPLRAGATGHPSAARRPRLPLDRGCGPRPCRCCSCRPTSPTRPSDRTGVRPRRGRPPPTPTSRSAPTARRSGSGSSYRAACSTAPAGRSPARWWRSGRPTRRAATATAATSGRARSTRTSPAAGGALTDADGRYRFTTIKPGAYPWGNHPNAWRPAHIHFSVFGWAFTQRLVTQMYFPDDPLFSQDPIFNSIARPGGAPAARRPLRPRRDRGAVGARVPLRHRRARPRRHAVRGGPAMMSRQLTPSQTVGPFLHLALADPALATPVAADDPGALRSPVRSSTARATRCPTRVVETGSGAARSPGCATEVTGGVVGAHPPTGRRGRPSAGRPRRRTSSCPCSPAACSTASSPGSTSTATRQRRRPGAGARRPTGGRCSPGRRCDGTWRFDIHLRGDDESVFFDRLTRSPSSSPPDRSPR